MHKGLSSQQQRNTLIRGPVPEGELDSTAVLYGTSNGRGHAPRLAALALNTTRVERRIEGKNVGDNECTWGDQRKTVDKTE